QPHRHTAPRPVELPATASRLRPRQRKYRCHDARRYSRGRWAGKDCNRSALYELMGKPDTGMCLMKNDQWVGCDLPRVESEGQMYTCPKCGILWVVTRVFKEWGPPISYCVDW